MCLVTRFQSRSSSFTFFSKVLCSANKFFNIQTSLPFEGINHVTKKLTTYIRYSVLILFIFFLKDNTYQIPRVGKKKKHSSLYLCHLFFAACLIQMMKNVLLNIILLSIIFALLSIVKKSYIVRLQPHQEKQRMDFVSQTITDKNNVHLLSVLKN